MKKSIIITCSMLMMIGVISCASNGFLMSKARVHHITQTYPPKAEDSKIDVFTTSKPEGNFNEFAKISCKSTNDDWSQKQILKKAREIGADGVIVMENSGSKGTVVAGSVVPGDYGMKAVAIKYTE